MRETDDLPPSLARHIDHVCDCFETSWKVWRSGERPRITDFLGRTRDRDRSLLLHELIQLEVYYRAGRGEDWTVEEFRSHFPEVDAAWLKSLQQGSEASRRETSSLASTTPHLHTASAVSVTPIEGPPFAGYELLETIRSGMAVVYKARQVRPQRLVALKAILPRAGTMPAELQRFLHTEAGHVARLDHPHIVPIYEVGVSEGRPYFSMKWVEGGSLAQAVAEGKWPIACNVSARLAARLVAKAARAVHYAHQRGILHCDLKPANILLDLDGQPYVNDFGLARPLGEGSLSLFGEVTGTPNYMSPEQATGAKGLTTKVDVYGLGAVLYELLTGRPPFRGESVSDTIRRVREEEPEPPHTRNPSVAGDLEIICLACLAKQPDSRFGSAEALAEDLERWLDGKPILARPGSAWERGLKWARCHPAATGLAGLTILLLLLVFGVVVWQWRASVAAQEAAEERKKLARVNDAALLTLMVTESQQLYSSEVVDRIIGKVDVSHDYTVKDGTIPLPPTLTMILAQRISEKSSGTVRLYSDLPFRSRKNPPTLDAFEREALQALRRKPSEPFYRFEVWNGRSSLRYASADVMQQRCVKCHNEHKDSPKKDWKVGDVRGVLEVILPVD